MNQYKNYENLRTKVFKLMEDLRNTRIVEVMAGIYTKEEK
jgi:hypothetical protein